MSFSIKLFLAAHALESLLVYLDGLFFIVVACLIWHLFIQGLVA